MARAFGSFSIFQKLAADSSDAMNRASRTIGKQQRRKAHSAARLYKPAAVGERGAAGLKTHKILRPPPPDVRAAICAANAAARLHSPSPLK